jgi:thymidine kinase
MNPLFVWIPVNMLVILYLCVNVIKRRKTKPNETKHINMIRIATPEQVALAGHDRGLIFITGPMFAGKTTMLEMYAQLAEQRKENVLRVAYAQDTRYGADENVMVTHDQIHVRVDYKVDSLSKIPHGIVNSADKIMIDECQFYDDIVDFCATWIALGKCIYVAGLNGTYQRKSFSRIADLLPLVRRVEVLTAKCECGQDEAIFTAKKVTESASKRVTESASKKVVEVNDPAIEIGGSELYFSCCPKCWHQTQHVATQYRNVHTEAQYQNAVEIEIKADEMPFQQADFPDPLSNVTFAFEGDGITPDAASITKDVGLQLQNGFDGKPTELKIESDPEMFTAAQFPTMQSVMLRRRRI